MADQLCCVCGKPSTKTIGQRAFCDEHFETATHQRKGVWRSVWGQVIALVVFVVLVYAAEAFFKPVLGQTALVLAGVVLAVVPALIWLAFFYQQDRLEPEPKALYRQRVHPGHAGGGGHLAPTWLKMSSAFPNGCTPTR